MSEVIRLTSQHLNGLPRSQALVTEVVAQAHLFRDIRNYALHPVEDDDEDRQAWLTESGATCSPLPGVATSFGSLNFTRGWPGPTAQIANRAVTKLNEESLIAAARPAAQRGHAPLGRAQPGP